MGIETAKDLFRRYGGGWCYVRNPYWRRLGLCIDLGYEPCEKDIAEGLINHESVTTYLKKHCDEEDFEERYFHPSGKLNYYKVLTLAELDHAKMEVARLSRLAGIEWE